MGRDIYADRDWNALLEASAEAAEPLRGTGTVADYIPALANVDDMRFGIAAVTIQGEEYVWGDARVPFSIQSISKVFSLVLACRTLGADLWARVGQLPSTNRFNSLLELELEAGIPRNPFLNAGALAVVDALATRHLSVEGAVVQLLRQASGSPLLDYDRHVATSELSCSYRNTAAAYLMKSFDNLRNPVAEVMRSYCALCAIRASCVELAHAGVFLANQGVCARTRAQVVAAEVTRQTCALMMTSGTYEASGRTAVLTGLPIKSGVGGGLLAVIPGFGAVCAWSPRLDGSGSSVMGMAAVEYLSKQAGISMFH